MKFSPAILTTYFQGESAKSNIRLLLRFVFLLVALVTLYSVIFHFLMAYEGRYHSWITGFYWTLTVMTTLGFGDITFNSDLGRTFSILVLLSGVFLFLTLLPLSSSSFFMPPGLKRRRGTGPPAICRRIRKTM
jgi:lipoprotein signal peptidase